MTSFNACREFSLQTLTLDNSATVPIPLKLHQLILQRYLVNVRFSLIRKVKGRDEEMDVAALQAEPERVRGINELNIRLGGVTSLSLDYKARARKSGLHYLRPGPV